MDEGPGRSARRTAAALLAVALSLGLAACGAEDAAEDRVEPPAPPPAAVEERAPEDERPAAEPATTPAADVVARVVDGDTIRLESGAAVRLVQIDAPELRDGECYAGEATAELERLLPPGTRVRIETDPALDDVDRYDRVLAYVYKGRENVNLTLVVRGAASVWFYRGARGRYADGLLAAARKAQEAGRGLWGACEARLDPLSAVSTSPRSAGGGSAATGGWCAGAIGWQEARGRVGEDVRVKAEVVRSHYARTSNGRPTFIDLGRAYPDPGRLTILIWGESRASLPSPPERMFPAGEPICVEGGVSTYRGVAQIQVGRWDAERRLLAP